MPKKKLTTKDRAEFTLHKVLNAGKWIVLSGTATFFLTEVLTLVREIELPNWAILTVYLFVNTLLFAIAKFNEGQE